MTLLEKEKSNLKTQLDEVKTTNSLLKGMNEYLKHSLDATGKTAVVLAEQVGEQKHANMVESKEHGQFAREVSRTLFNRNVLPKKKDDLY